MAGISSRDGFGGSSLPVTITTTFWGGGRYSEVVRKSSRTECLAGPSDGQPELYPARPRVMCFRRAACRKLRVSCGDQEPAFVTARGIIETIVVSREEWAEIRLRLDVSGCILRGALGAPGPNTSDQPAA